MSQREPSHPPSDPRPTRARSSGDGFPTAERPPRAQLVAAAVVGLLLVAGGLYMWRRPHASSDAAGSEAASPSASALAVEDPHNPGASVAMLDAGGPSPVSLSEARILGCHDKGARKTPADQCDHVATVEQALAQAIAQSASCSASSPSGGTIEYVADVSFLRRKVRISLPRAGRSLRDRKVIGACGAAVREAMDAVALDGTDHEHARYKISVIATYRGKISG
ncbi:MAG TPA: hypothetical protein VII82_00840 [Polyangiaceae bacterium]|jgi:hypothetical protein